MRYPTNFLLLVSLTPITSIASAQTAENSMLSSVQHAIVSQTNKLRQKNDLPAISVNEERAATATDFAEFMAKSGKYGHHRFKAMSQLTRLAYLNFRNHRKLAVVDGERAILGGANIVEDEMTTESNGDTCVDLSVWIEGPAATQLQAVFCRDRNFETDENLPPSELEESDAADPGEGSRLTVMPIGPDGPDEILDDFWQFAIHQAKHRIWICTPYFVPPPMAMRSLELACRRGIDVQIIVPQVSDLRPVDYARFAYFKDLIEVGCKVYRYPDRMVHAKVGIIDDLVALVGSANFDVRSFFLNYELSVLIHDKETISQVSSWYEELSQGCESGVTDRSTFRSAMATAVRLFADEL